MRIAILLAACVALSACLSSNLVKYETDLAESVISHNAFDELTYADVMLGERLKYKISGQLPVIATEHGKAFALPLNVPDGSKSIYFRSVLSTASAKTAHVVYPTFIFFDAEMSELGHTEPTMTPRNDMSFDAAYFDGSVELPAAASRVVALFSPEHFGRQFRYTATMFVGTYTSGMVIGGESKTDDGIPVGPGGPFRVEFRDLVEDE